MSFINRSIEQFSVPATIPQCLSHTRSYPQGIMEINYNELYLSAHRLFEAQNYLECINVAQSLANSPHLSFKSHGCLILGACYFNLRLFDESIRHSSLALQYDPSLAGAYYNLANALKVMNRLEEARDCLRQGLIICPAFVGAHLLYANVLVYLGDFETALEEYKSVVKLCPDMMIAYYNLSVLQLKLKRVTECAQTYGVIADLLKAANETDKALNYYREACKLKKEDWEVFYKYGVALKEANKPNEALQVLKTALVLNNNSSLLHFQVGCVYETLGNDSRALVHYQRAVSLDTLYTDR